MSKLFLVFRPEDLQNLVESISLPELIAEFTELKDGKGLCPICSHQTAFRLMKDGDFYCKSCGKRGDVIDFVMDFFRTDLLSAVKWLSRKYSIQVRYI